MLFNLNMLMGERESPSRQSCDDYEQDETRESAMSNLRSIDMLFLESLLAMGDGYCWRRMKIDQLGVRRKSWTDLRRKSETFPVFRGAERPKRYLDSLFVVPVDI